MNLKWQSMDVKDFDRGFSTGIYRHMEELESRMEPK